MSPIDINKLENLYLIPQNEDFKRKKVSASSQQPSPPNESLYSQSLKSSSEITLYQQPTLSPSIPEGTLISAKLISGINSTLTGLVVAIVEAPIYNNQGMQIIPAGSKLIGHYKNTKLIESHRLQVFWDQLILHNGTVYDLPSISSKDISGYTGLHDIKKTPFARLYLQTAALSLLDSAQNNINIQNLNNNAKISLGLGLSKTTSKILDQHIEKAQTVLIIRPGYRFKILIPYKINAKNKDSH